MIGHDPVVFRQLPVIQKIIRDETWLEGERRGCPVTPNDPVVRENVCRVILRIGAQLREAMSRVIGPAQSEADVGSITAMPTMPWHNDAA